MSTEHTVVDVHGRTHRWTRSMGSPKKDGAASIPDLFKKVLKRGQTQPPPPPEVARSSASDAMADPELAAVEQEQQRLQRQVGAA
eukprot:1161045-Pelagomonas_calceolata.AAC.5